MKPRIYTYKITFPNQGWWYWGIHKERIYNEVYNGSPVTHREKWDLFEFEKQILEVFDTWEEACLVEARLILPDLNNPSCLNERVFGVRSIDSYSRAGKKGGAVQGKISSEKGTGIHSMSREEKQEAGSIGGKRGGKKGGKIVGSTPWWTNGEKTIRSWDPPPGFRRGRK